MGALSFTDQELADKAIDAGRSTLAADYQHFVYDLRAGTGKDNDFGRLLTLAIDGIAQVGWQLHSVAPYMNTIGPNNIAALIAFERR